MFRAFTHFIPHRANAACDVGKGGGAEPNVAATGMGTVCAVYVWQWQLKNKIKINYGSLAFSLKKKNASSLSYYYYFLNVPENAIST